MRTSESPWKSSAWRGRARRWYRLWINGIPVALLLPGEADGMVGVPLNEYIVSGTNRIGVVLHAGPLASRSADPWPSHAMAAVYSGPAALKLSLAQYAADQPVHRDGPPATSTWSWRERTSSGLQHVPEEASAPKDAHLRFGDTPALGRASQSCRDEATGCE